MNITIRTIDHKSQRYDTCGDWKFEENGDLTITVSLMDNWKYEMLVAFHELIEVLLCKDRNITDEQVMAFDRMFEEMRTKYPSIVGDREPGNDPAAPYAREHQTATGMEHAMAAELGVDWSEYANKIISLEYGAKDQITAPQSSGGAECPVSSGASVEEGTQKNP